MKRKFLLLALASSLGPQTRAAIPPAEQLLPTNTVAILSLPDTVRALAACRTNATGRFWCDPAMKPFRDRLLSAAREEFVAPLERELGLNLADFRGLVQGQLTLAGIRTGTSNDTALSWLLLADVRERSNDLALRLTGLRTNLATLNPPPRTNQFRDVEITTVDLHGGSLMNVLQRAFASPGSNGRDSTNAAPTATSADSGAMRLSFGQSGSLLFVGTDVGPIQEVLGRLAGGGAPTFGDNASFRKEQERRFKQSLAYAWADLQPWMNDLTRWVAALDAQTRDEDPKRPMPKRAKVLTATGVTAARTVALAWHERADGNLFELDLEVPPTNRAGLFKLFEFEPRDSGPPSFVPADVLAFQRCRPNLPASWATLEQMFIDVFPPARSVLNFLLQTAGKDTDANYDLRSELIGSLGDDIVRYEPAPRSNTWAELRSPPSLALVGSTNADRLALALKAAAGLFMSPTTRTVQGRNVYSFSLPAAASEGASAGGVSSFSVAAVATNLVALTSDTNLLESVLSVTNAPARALGALPGLNEAAQQVGGTNTGWFGYANVAAGRRATFESLKQHPDSALALVPSGYLLAITGLRLEDPLQRFLARCDFTLLPPFDQVARYFDFTVYTVGSDAEGYHYRSFAPIPPALSATTAEVAPAQSPSK